MLKKIQLKTMLVSHGENGEDIIRTESAGGCFIEENGLLLRYAEPENDGTVSLLLTDGLADLKRRGRTTSRMTFIEGKMLPCPYHTPQGDMDISIYTHTQEFDVHAAGGRFQAKYSLMAAGRQVADNVLTIEWTFS